MFKRKAHKSISMLIVPVEGTGVLLIALEPGECALYEITPESR